MLSTLLVEVSLYANFMFRRMLDDGSFSKITSFTRSHILDLFYHMQGKEVPMQRLPQNEEFFELREHVYSEIGR